MSWTLHLGDCLDPVTGLASLGDKSVDHVITDPPYSERTHAGARSHKDVDAPSIGFSAINDFGLRVAFNEASRVSRRWLLATVDWRHVGELESMPPGEHPDGDKPNQLRMFEEAH